MYTVSEKALSSSRRGRAFLSDLKKAGVSKAQLKRVATKFFALARPESVGEYVRTKKGTRVYAVRQAAKGGKIFVYKSSGGAGLGGKALVVFVPSKNKRHHTNH